MKYAAIDINWDSLGEAYGFPVDYQDPTFTTVAERFMQIADRYGFRYSIYVIGKDLEKTDNRTAVKAWSDAGHEIGSHTWSHPRNLGGLSAEQIEREIEQAHRIITDTLGHPPQGFIAPSWNTSARLLQTLIEFGYTYDTSVFPSWLYYPVLAKLIINYMGDRKLFTLLNRRDYHRFFTAPRQIYISDAHYRKTDAFQSAITIMPVPTTRYRMASWHTLAFLLGWERHESILKSAMKHTQAFYYLAHPADLIGVEDLDPNRPIHLQRMDVPLQQKLDYFEKAIQLIVESGRQIITMGEMAQKFREGKLS